MRDNLYDLQVFIGSIISNPSFESKSEIKTDEAVALINRSVDQMERCGEYLRKSIDWIEAIVEDGKIK